METLQAIFPARDCALLVAILTLPLLGAIVNGLFGKRLGKEAVTLMGLATVGASFAGSVAAFLMLRAAQTGNDAARLVWRGWEWVSLSTSGEVNAIGQGGAIPRLHIEVAFSVDALSGTMALIVTGVGFLIHLYSTKYMEDDPGYHRFFAYLNLFIFSMLVLILGDSLPVLFVGWEGVGLCSYLLIGFWFGDKANAAAGKKAFIVNRIGDFGLLVAMALLVRFVGELSWSGIAGGAEALLRPMTIRQVPLFQDTFLSSLAGPYQVSAATLVGLALFLGCAGKSAQVPLYVWLPDAMAGPTPVSALIHAATMVTAGVYLVCRMAPVFVLSPAAMFTVACAGAFTALLAATIALVQNDIKKVLAYSTVSQLGYMFMGVGVGAFTAGFFHVMTHAFFKACLFLGAGAVIHAMHARIHDGEASQDIRKMGGLREHLPITHVTFLVSCLAIAGFPFSSGYYSKDEILLNALTSKVVAPTADGTIQSSAGQITLFAWPELGGKILFAAGVAGAVLTAFYMFRLYFLTFWGDFRGWKIVSGWKAPEHGDHGHDGHGHDAHGHGAHDEGPLDGPAPQEAHWAMFVPLVVLAVLAAVAGLLWTHPIEHWLEPVFAAARKSVQVTEKPGFVPVLAILAFAAGAGGAFWVYFQERGEPARRLAEQFPGLHKLLVEKWRVDELYDEFFVGTLDFVADVCVWVDKWVVDGIVARFTAWTVAVAGHLLRLLQTGRVQVYATSMVVGTAAMGWFFATPQAKAHVEGDHAAGRYTVHAAPGLGYAFRWDADADGKPDSPDFGEKTSVELTLGVGESRAVLLEVRNAFGRVGTRKVELSRPKSDDSREARATTGDRRRLAALAGGDAMSPLVAALVDVWPFLFAFGFGAFLPRRQGWLERVALGVVSVLAVAMVRSLWPGAAVADDAAPGEWPHLLTVIVFLPIAGAVAILFLPRQTPGLLRRFTLGLMLVDFVVSLGLLSVPMTKGWHFQHVAEWLPAFGIRYHVAVDGLSLWLVLLTTLTTPIAAYTSFGSIHKRTKDLCFSFLLLQGGMLGAFVALDLFLFYVFWELMLIPMILIIGIWGGTEKIKAAYKFFLYTMFGSVLMLAAILYMVWAHHQAAGYVTFDYLALRRLILPSTAAWLCYAAFGLAFVIKVPMWPFHTWLPDAHVQAPTGGSVILAAVLLKLGTYGYIRFCMGMFEGPAWASGATLATVAVAFGIVYGALVAWKQPDVKKLVAYSSVAHLGFVMLGIFGATQAGVEGAVLQMVNHGISTGALFLLIGVIYDRRHTRLLSEFGGLARPMPVYAAVFVVITMSSVGVPGTNGFVGEFMIIMGTIVSQVLDKHATSQASVAAFGVILAAVYMLHVVQKMFFGPVDNPKNEHLEDLSPRETIALAPLVALVFVIGLFPSVFLSRMTESVTGVLDHFVAGRMLYEEHAGDTAPSLRSQRGGPLEQGYPEPPAEGSVAANEVAR